MSVGVKKLGRRVLYFMKSDCSHISVRSRSVCSHNPRPRSRPCVPRVCSGACAGRTRFLACGAPVQRQLCIGVEASFEFFSVRIEVHQLSIAHIGDLVHFNVSVRSYELLDDHEPSAHSDDKLSVQDLGIDLLGTEEVESVSQLPDGHGAVSLVDVVAEHLVEQVSLRQREHWSLLLLLDPLVHDFNDLVFVLQKSFQVLDLFDLLRCRLREVVQSVDQQILVLRESLDVRLVSIDVPLQVLDLACLQLDLLVEFDSLLADDVQLLDLVIDHGLPLFQSEVDLLDLALNLLDLLLCVLNHLVAILDLALEMVGEFILLSLLEVLL